VLKKDREIESWPVSHYETYMAIVLTTTIVEVEGNEIIVGS
jgi:hypothetical protein